MDGNLPLTANADLSRPNLSRFERRFEQWRVRGGLLLAPLAFAGIAFLEGHFITPCIMGHRLTLHPLTVFLSLIFWTWLWGPVGAFLAVPLLIVGVVAAGHIFPKEEPALPD